MKNKNPDSQENELPENDPEQTGNEGSEQENSAPAPEAPAEKEAWKQQVEEAKSKYLYLLSDFETFKRNVAKERLELQSTAGRDIVTELLSVLDDFDRAAKNDSLSEGTILIHHKLLHILQTKGLSELECKPGDTFNSDNQEAVVEIQAPSKDQKGKIIEVLDKGYLFGGRIIRYAKVVVGC